MLVIWEAGGTRKLHVLQIGELENSQNRHNVHYRRPRSAAIRANVGSSADSGTERLRGAGHDGGLVVFEGTPADLVAARSTLTGEHLASYVGA